MIVRRLSLFIGAGLGTALLCACHPPTAAPAPGVKPLAPPVLPAQELPPPQPARQAATCATGTNRWLASRPRVPLAVVDDHSIASAGKDCCQPWSTAEASWQGVDAWGQPLTTARVSGADYYDATQCWELSLEPQSEDTPPALYVSGTWTPTPSFQWQPSAQERADFTVFLAALQTMTVSPEYHRAGDTKRRNPKPAFFQLPASDDSANVHPTKFAAVGGSSLAIAYIAGDGRWKLGTLLNDTALPITSGDAYAVVAILDMNNDGLPEVVVHSDEGPAWNDVVLSLDNPYQRYSWDVTARGIIGGTM